MGTDVFLEMSITDELVKSLSFPPPISTFEGRLRRESRNG